MQLVITQTGYHWNNKILILYYFFRQRYQRVNSEAKWVNPLSCTMEFVTAEFDIYLNVTQLKRRSLQRASKKAKKATDSIENEFGNGHQSYVGWFVFQLNSSALGERVNLRWCNGWADDDEFQPRSFPFSLEFEIEWRNRVGKVFHNEIFNWRIARSVLLSSEAMRRCRR